MKKALITGVAGQDGSYLAELLLDKGYEVHGLIRRSSNPDLPNIANIRDQIILHHGDLSDANNVRNLIDQIGPSEIYNLAAQSHVKVSFEMPEMTGDINGLGTLRILDAMRGLKMQDTRFYQASTSELYGLVETAPQNEKTVFQPASPYAAAKLYAYWITVNYRESYNMFACNGILFNHESPRRNELFVTRKITRSFARMVLGKQKLLELGNVDSRRDWGHAKDYVRAMWLMLQKDQPDDYVIATGQQHSIRDFCNLTAGYFGIDLSWEGEGLDAKAYNAQTGQLVIAVNPLYYRPVDVINLQGDCTKAKNALQWTTEYDLDGLVKTMCEEDFKQLKEAK
jgi:GDPmannose 4,6-dehydratase